MCVIEKVPVRDLFGEKVIRKFVNVKTEQTLLSIFNYGFRSTSDFY